MIGSIPSVSFGTGAMDKVSQEKLNSYGPYSMPDMGTQAPTQHKKKGGFFRFLGKLILTAAIVGGALVGARKLIPAVKNHEIVEIEEGAKFGKKAMNYLAKAADWVENTVVGAYKKVFTKKQKLDTEA